MAHKDNAYNLKNHNIPNIICNIYFVHKKSTAFLIKQYSYEQFQLMQYTCTSLVST